MAVSEVSSTYQNDPYVLPFDLNLFSKVMTYKQAKFDSGAQKIQGEIDQMGSLDVLKQQDKSYVNGKIKNLVDGVNGLGGVDLSDNNIVNQIEGFGSDIYSDDKVLTAVAGTKAVRSLQQGYAAMKSNPKLNKLYSPVNEAYDNRAVQAWATDGQTGSAYNGTSTPTPYVPYRENHLKAFAGLTANMREKVTDKGLVYVTDQNQEITPERVMQMAQDQLQPQERDQMKRDAWYLYKDVPSQAIIQKSLDFNNQKLQRSKQIYDNYQANAAAATADPVARQNYLDLAKQQESEMNNYMQGSVDIAKNGVKQFSQNPEEYMYNVYSNDYFRGLAEKFAYSKNSTKITPNTAEMFKERQQQSHDQFEQNLQFQKEKFGQEQEMNAIKLGMKMFKDPLTGKMKQVSAGYDIPNTNTAANLDQYKASEQIYKNQEVTLEQQKQTLASDFIAGLVRNDPSLGSIVSSTQTGTGISNRLTGIEGLTNNIPGKPGFNLENLNIDKNAPQTQAWMAKNHVSDKQADFLKSLYTNYEKMANGEPVDFSRMPKGFPDLVEKFQMINEQVRALNAKTQSVNQTANEHVGITDDDMKFFNNYAHVQNTVNDKLYHNRAQSLGFGDLYGGGNRFKPAGSPTTASNDDVSAQAYLDQNRKKYEAIRNKGQAAQTYKDQLYQQPENRPVFNQKTIVDGKDKSIAAMFLGNLQQQGSVDNPKLRGATFPIDDVHILQAGRSADGTDSYDLTANVKSKDGTAQNYTVKVTGDQARQLGFQSDPYSMLNEAVNLTGRSGDLFINGGKQLVTRVNIVRSGNDRNDQSSYAQILIPTGDKTHPYNYLDLPEVVGETPSEAYARAKELITNYGKLGGTLTQLHQEMLDKYYK